MKEEIIVLHDLRCILPEARDQGPRPLCLAFSASDLNAMSNNISQALSVEFLAYYTYLREGHNDYSSGLTTKGIIETLKHIGQPYEVFLPYDLSAKVPKKPEEQACELFCLESQESLDFLTSIDNQLEKGVGTVACISLPPAFRTIRAPFLLDKEGGYIGNHAVVIVGSGISNSGSKLYLIRNSWGSAWGDNGHCWLSKGFLNERMFALLEVTN